MSLLSIKVYLLFVGLVYFTGFTYFELQITPTYLFLLKLL